MRLPRRVLGVLIASAGLAASCAAPTPPAAAPPTAAPQAATPAPAANAAAPEPQSWLDILPAGTGREVVLQNCGGCHGFERLVLGQRSADRWDNIKAGHRDKTPGLSDADYNAAFAYLAQNFNPSKPEPKIPAHLRGPATAE